VADLVDDGVNEMRRHHLACGSREKHLEWPPPSGIHR
jgi:hypothetical protein